MQCALCAVHAKHPKYSFDSYRSYFTGLKHVQQGVTKRCRLSLLTNSVLVTLLLYIDTYLNSNPEIKKILWSTNN